MLKMRMSNTSNLLLCLILLLIYGSFLSITLLKYICDVLEPVTSRSVYSLRYVSSAVPREAFRPIPYLSPGRTLVSSKTHLPLQPVSREVFDMFTRIINNSNLQQPNERENMRETPAVTRTAALPTASEFSSSWKPRQRPEVTSDDDVLLTLFTTFRSSVDRHEIHHNTINSWASLIQLGVRPVLYVADEEHNSTTPNGTSDLVTFSRQRGWTVRKCPMVSAHGVPILRSLFIDAEKTSRSTFYGYANADIMFDQSLPQTLSAILPNLDRLLSSQNASKNGLSELLVTGVRTDCTVASASSPSPSTAQTTSQDSDCNIIDKLPRVSNQKSSSVSEVIAELPCKNGQSSCRTLRANFDPTESRAKVKRQRRQLRRRQTLTSAQDYFITVRSGMPWKTTPDFVVGRAGVDNWLLVTALVHGASVIDTSKTVTARHQVTSDYHPAAHYNRPGNDGRSNYEMAGQRFDYSLGLTDCAPLETAYRGRTASSVNDTLTNSVSTNSSTSGTRANPETLPRRDRQLRNGIDSEAASIELLVRPLSRYCKRAYTKSGISLRKFLNKKRLTTAG